MSANLYSIALLLGATCGIYGLVRVVYYDGKLRKNLKDETIKNYYSTQLKSSIWILIAFFIYGGFLIFIRFKFL